MRLQHKRDAFSMITAIVVMILMSSVTLLIMNMSGKIVQETMLQYQREQAVLLSKSYTEYAILAVTANNRTGTNCLSDINGIFGDINDGGYTIRTRIAYIGHTGELTQCASTRVLNDNNVVHPGSPLNIIVDVYVEYQLIDSSNTNALTYHKRTLQKI